MCFQKQPGGSRSTDFLLKIIRVEGQQTDNLVFSLSDKSVCADGICGFELFQQLTTTTTTAKIPLKLCIKAACRRTEPPRFLISTLDGNLDHEPAGCGAVRLHVL